MNRSLQRVERSADRTWSVPEMVERLCRALMQVIEAGDTLVPCLRGPEADAPGRPDFERAVRVYIDHYRQRAFTHERALALADYLDRMTPPPPGAEYTGSAGYREFWEEEYRLARDIYEGQRVMLRETLGLGEGEPEILCMMLPPADAAASTPHPNRVVLGRDSDGYRVGLLPVETGGAVVWTTPIADREQAMETASQIHRDSPEIAIAMEEAMAMNAQTTSGVRP